MNQDDMDTPSDRIDYSRALDEEAVFSIVLHELSKIEEKAMRARLRDYIVEERNTRIFGNKA